MLVQNTLDATDRCVVLCLAALAFFNGLIQVLRADVRHYDFSALDLEELDDDTWWLSWISIFFF